MEQLVRPFQLLDPTATIRVPVVRDQVAVNPAHLCWGAAGNLPMAVQQADNFDGINFRLHECDMHLSESKRDTEQVRVENPSDPSQYVMVERIRKIDMSSTGKGDFVNTFNTDTLNITVPDVFANSGFGDVPKQNACNQAFYYNR